MIGRATSLIQLLEDMIHQRHFWALVPIAFVDQIAVARRVRFGFGGAVARQVNQLADIGRDHGLDPSAFK
jgi:hypothetical protein